MSRDVSCARTTEESALRRAEGVGRRGMGARGREGARRGLHPEGRSQLPLALMVVLLGSPTRDFSGPGRVTSLVEPWPPWVGVHRGAERQQTTQSSSTKRQKEKHESADARVQFPVRLCLPWCSKKHWVAWGCFSFWVGPAEELGIKNGKGELSNKGNNFFSFIFGFFFF